MAPTLREADRREIAALGLEPEPALAASVAASRAAYAAVEHGDDAPLALFGVAAFADAPTIGAPWLMGADALSAHRRALVRDAPLLLARLAAPFELLLNRVHADNRRHVAWLRRMGFTLYARRTDLGPGGDLFFEFARLEPIGQARARRSVGARRRPIV